MCLLCVALNGFHDANCSYQWKREDALQGEVYPVIYCNKAGTYSCTVIARNSQHVGIFLVTCKYGLLYKHSYTQYLLLVTAGGALTARVRSDISSESSSLTSSIPSK